MTVTKATIVKDILGPDLVLLHTNLPCPMGIKRFAMSYIDVPKNKGFDYVRTHFPNIEVEIKPL